MEIPVREFQSTIKKLQQPKGAQTLKMDTQKSTQSVLPILLHLLT